VYCTVTEVFLNLTEVFPCIFLSWKANARVKLADGTRFALFHISLYLCCSDVIICVVRFLFVLFYVLFVCKCVLPPGDNPIAVNTYIISYHPPACTCEKRIEKKMSMDLWWNDTDRGETSRER
jgi:hypothetical protein